MTFVIYKQEILNLILVQEYNSGAKATQSYPSTRKWGGGDGREGITLLLRPI